MPHLRVSISAQRLDIVSDDGSISRSFPVSTAKKGTGSEPNSNKTPLGPAPDHPVLWVSNELDEAPWGEVVKI